MPDVRITRASGADAELVRGLAERATAEAGSPVLNEQSLIALGGAADVPARVLLATADAVGAVGAVVSEVGPAATTAELVLPDGPLAATAGAALLDALEADPEVPADRPLQLWAHGRGSRTTPLARERGYRAIRSLYKLRRDGDLPVPEAPLPEGVALSTFRPGIDDADWLAVNAEAFAAHAEQGRWSAADLHARIAEDWFDPAGFFLARSEDSGQLLGFHWTKVERARAGGEPISGEVYVIGISHAAAGMRLGSALLAVGLRYLQDIGAPVVYLYVDGDNTAARALYTNRGFVEDDLDICYQVR